jgi:hypothetical protein
MCGYRLVSDGPEEGKLVYSSEHDNEPLNSVGSEHEALINE